MPWTLIANTAVTTGDISSVTTPAIDTTGADLLVVGLAYNVIGTPTLSDSYGNTWTGLGVSDAISNSIEMFYVNGGTVGAGHTFSANGALTAPNVAVMAWSGSKNSPPDGNTGADSASTNVTTISPGSLTPSENGELLITGLAYNPDEAITVSSDYTISNQSAVASSRNVALAYRTQRSAATSTPTWTWTTASPAATRFATFKILEYEPAENLLVVNTFSEDKTASQSSYTFPASGTWAPNANEVVIIGVGSRKLVGPPLQPTVTGTGGWNVTWDALDHELTQGNNTTAVTLYAGFITDATAGTVTVDYGGTNHAQTGVVALSVANSDYTKTGFATFVDDTTDGSIGITGFVPTFTDLGYLFVAVSRGTPSDFSPAYGEVHATTVTGGIMGLTGIWIENGDGDFEVIGNFTSGTNAGTIMVEVPLTGARPALGQERNRVVF